jgi:hypothetical protein
MAPFRPTPSIASTDKTPLNFLRIGRIGQRSNRPTLGCARHLRLLNVIPSENVEYHLTGSNQNRVKRREFITRVPTARMRPK